MRKTLEQLGYKVVAIQDECFTGTENSKEAIVVIVRLEKLGKRNLSIKYDVKEFPSVEYLDKWMKENNLKKAIPSEKFKAPRVNQALHLIKALSLNR